MLAEIQVGLLLQRHTLVEAPEQNYPDVSFGVEVTVVVAEA